MKRKAPHPPATKSARKPASATRVPTRPPAKRDSRAAGSFPPAARPKPTKQAGAGLNHRQAQFVREYLVDLNATQAAIRAGYAEKTAEVCGPRLLGNVRVAAAVEKALAERAQRTEISQDRVLRELAALGFANMADYIRVQPDGTAYVNLAGLSREQAAAIQELTVDEYTEGRGEEARAVKRVKLKLADKRGSLELLGRHLGLFPNRTELTGAGGGPVEIKAETVGRLSDEQLEEIVEAARKGAQP